MGSDQFVSFGRYLFAAVIAALVIAVPAQAQGRIMPGQTVSGRLDSSDRLRDDGTYYEDWFYEGRAGEQITVTQRSGDFDSWLLLGRMVGGEFTLTEFNDDGAGGNDAQITHTLPADGRYVFRVNVVGRGRTGAYTLHVTGSSMQPIRSAAPGTLIAGRTFSGELDSSDPVWTDDTFYELWRYHGRAGERLTIVMRSPAFRSYMQYGRMNGSDFSYLGGSSGRTVGGQQETVIEATLSETGEYGIRANSHGRSTGSYTLTVSSSLRSGGTVGPARTTPSLAVGSRVNGSLQVSDMQTDSGWYHDDYTFSGSRGEVIYVDMMSPDFDTYLDIYGDDADRIASDDDGGEGLNSRLVFTLPASGTFTICARSRYANRTGSYTLSVR